MLNRNLFRENPEVVRVALRRRGADARVADVDRMVDLDERAGIPDGFTLPVAPRLKLC